jgi:hypothetical protein
MISVLTAFILYTTEASWHWWVLYGLVISINLILATLVTVLKAE